MRLLWRLLAVSFLWVFPVVLSEQTVLSSSNAVNQPHTLELSALSFCDFTTFSHPAFPGRSARIKKTIFCDGGRNMKEYTGYIDIGSKHLFFYFFESRNDPKTDDVLLWTNGGPGGSSALALLMELGPCTIAEPHAVKYNPHSWNNNANIFFIDQPVGVGMSYHDLGPDHGTSTTEESAIDIAAFMATFFETFKSFKGRRFHMTGESYGGRYLPVYASAVYDQNEYLVAKNMTPINLVSVAIGNGATDFWALIRSHVEMQCTVMDGLSKPIQPIGVCVRMREALKRCKRRQQSACIDHFDTMDCASAFSFCHDELMWPYITKGYNYYDITMRCDTDTNCYPEKWDVQELLNSPTTRKLLGVDSQVGNMSIVAKPVYDRFWASGDPMHLTQPYVAELLARGVKVLIYAGTYDFIANWIGNEEWTLNMDWPGKAELNNAPLQEWFVDDLAAGKTRSSGNFTFATIYGAGHLVPHDKPVESLAMINRWIEDEKL